MGWNGYGQLGNGTFNNTNLPVSVASNVVAVAAGDAHSLFVKTDGTLWWTGGDTLESYGIYCSTNLPVMVASNVVAVAAGEEHSLFVDTNGTLWAMGFNGHGQLGNGTTTNAPTPVSVANNVVAVAAGTMHSLFVKTDGTLWAMGWNVDGQLGDGTYNDTNLPVNVPHLSVANVFPADQAYHSLAIGINYHATVMLGNLSQSYTGGAISVTASTTPPGLTVNLTYNGSPNAPTNPGSYTVIGIISDPHYSGSATNTLVVTPPPPPTITAGPTNQVLASGGTLTLSVSGGGQWLAYEWFKDSRRLLGATNSTLAVANAGETNSGIYYVAITNYGGMIISLPVFVAVGNPALFAWGKNDYGQLGNGGTSDTSQPLTVTSNVVAGAAGGFHSLFVTADGMLRTMGNNYYGQLGNGTNDVAAHPTPVSVASNVVAAAAGNSHSLFVTGNGTLWGMGWNSYGQLGNGTTSNTSLPESVASNVVAVAAGAYHSLFIKNDGSLWAMGQNLAGQLGNGTSSYSQTTPVSVASNVVAVAAGQVHSLFVTGDGTLWAMGYNGYGQLGIGTTSMTNLPASVAGNVVAAAAGSSHSLFVTADGTLWAMGENNDGQLGNGTTSNTNLPVSVASNVVAVAAGEYHSLFVTADGTLWAMGDNAEGELGNAMPSSTNLPVKAPDLFVANVFPADQADHSLAIGVILPIITSFTASSISSEQLTLHLTGEPIYPYILQSSTNLTPPVNWQSLFTNISDANGNWSFVITNLAGVPCRFYRAIGP
jgi:alpha-tubulin suppressor-like RCC1 family protein